MVGDILAYQQTTCQATRWPDGPPPADGSAGRSTNRPRVAPSATSALTLLSGYRARRSVTNQTEVTDNPRVDEETSLPRPRPRGSLPVHPFDEARRANGPCTTVIWYEGMPKPGFGAAIAMRFDNRLPEGRHIGRYHSAPAPQSVATTPRWACLNRASGPPHSGYPAMTRG
jgi:hypothetical protein